jgi:hypothetical protein
MDFGKTAGDNAKYRAGYPEALFPRLKDNRIGHTGQNILDIGTGIWPGPWPNKERK